jgi:tetrapyrrole methylase family protein/MazG family protein
MAGITLLGLGPGNPNQLTREAWEVLSGAKEIWLRTRHHPTVGALPAGVEVHTFDQLYDNGQTFEEVYDSITNQIARRV